MSNSPEIQALLETYAQLSNNNQGVLTLSATTRDVLRDVMEQSEGETDETMRLGVLTALAEAHDDTVTIPASVSHVLHHEIEGLLKPLGLLEERSLVHVPQYTTRMSDLEVCLLIREQLKKEMPITLPEIELMQLVDIINRSAPKDDHSHVLWRIAPFMKGLKKREMDAAESFFEVELPEEIAKKLLDELNQIEDDQETL